MAAAEFGNAGQRAGLEIWRIENFKPAPYPTKDHGKFYIGDSYLVLQTEVRGGLKSWNIHFWLGAETSQDESGTAAILSTQLDDLLGGAPVQYREIQEHESQVFLSYFPAGIRYLPGGIESGFAHVDPDSFEKRLFQVKGSRNVRVKQVPVALKSMNRGDCFILDLGREIYVYVGEKSKRMERLKAIDAANQVRDQDHAGKAKVFIIDESSTRGEVREFFEGLGEGSAEEVAPEDEGGDDAQFEKSQDKIVSLYRVSDASGSLKVDQVAQKDLDQSLLDTNDCFILDTSNSNIFVWVGKGCTQQEKTQAMKHAQDFLKTKDYPDWTQVVRVVEGGETTAFTQYFQVWRSAKKAHLTRSASVLNDSLEPRLFHAQIKRQMYSFQIEEIHNFAQKDLYEDDVMLLDLGKELFVWIGSGASVQERTRAPDLARAHLKRLQREKTTVTVINQGEEPSAFKAVFPEWRGDFWEGVSSYDDVKAKVGAANNAL